MNLNWRMTLFGCAVTLLAACSPQKQTNKAATETAPKAAAAKQAAQPRSCKFTMGFDVWEPYQFIGFGRKVQGLDIELINMVAEELDCDVDYKQDSWGNLLGQLKEGKIDFVLGASITEERKSFALFSDAYRSEEFQLYIRAEEEHSYRQASVVDFVRDNHKLGIINEYFYGDELTGLMDDAQFADRFKPTFMGEINLARLIDGDIDGFLEDSFVGASLIRRKGLEKRITPHQATIHTGDVYVMFSKLSIKPAMVNRFNGAMSNIKNNGKYDQLIQKYSD
ncbi:MAG: polar amino acid transport system substrate-binding protein [Alteromonadaceae bacterium]|jgi:polar amino acid transport system substrate-binding protein